MGRFQLLLEPFVGKKGKKKAPVFFRKQVLLAEDEGFEFAKESPLVTKPPHLVSLSSDIFL